MEMQEGLEARVITKHSKHGQATELLSLRVKENHFV